MTRTLYLEDEHERYLELAVRYLRLLKRIELLHAFGDSPEIDSVLSSIDPVDLKIVGQEIELIRSLYRTAPTSAVAKSFREFDTMTLARMAYCAIDAPDSVLGERIVALYNEIDCRIEHGADSNGHLEYVRDKLIRIAAGPRATTGTAALDPPTGRVSRSDGAESPSPVVTLPKVQCR